METGRIVSRSKALTTRDDLIKGITASLKGLGPVERISLVSLSTTLATNSIVEGKGCRVGLISLGRKFGQTVNVAEYKYLDAELDLKGRTVRRLIPNQVRSALESMRGKIDVLAVAGYMSVRNPSHEETVRSMANKILGIPVVCAHDLTSKLGFERRTNTAIINAGLIPTVMDLMASVRKALDDMGIVAPMMIVKGDGSLMNVATAMKRPIETIMSGPASSLTSAMVHSGVRDALIVDMGGTTTDLGIIRGGFVRTVDSGSVVGGHRTRVRAADVSTYGIGGDSRIYAEGGRIVLSSVRVIPICVASSRWDGIRADLESTDGWSPGRCEFYTPASNSDSSHLNAAEAAFLERIRGRPQSVEGAEASFGIPAEKLRIDEMESLGYVTRIGVTPTDILAAEGSYSEYDTEASKTAVSLLAHSVGREVPGFIRDVKGEIVRKICRCIMDHMARAGTGKEDLSEHDLLAIEVAMRGGESGGRRELGMPMVGIGAPVGAWLPEVARFFSSELILPENYDVGNAIGAISSSVTEVVEIPVRAAFGDFSDRPECVVYNGIESFDFQNKDEAMDFAVEEAGRIATSRAKDSGALDSTLEYKIDEIYADVKGKGKKVFRGATVLARATGKPMMHWFD